MLIAVSILSPVRTHSLMPALRMCLIASGTPSCNLSSIAVEPAISKSFSISAATFSSYSSLPFTQSDASK
jgi:hypothetical protein